MYSSPDKDILQGLLVPSDQLCFFIAFWCSFLSGQESTDSMYVHFLRKVVHGFRSKKDRESFDGLPAFLVVYWRLGFLWLCWVVFVCLGKS